MATVFSPPSPIKAYTQSVNETAKMWLEPNYKSEQWQEML